MRWWPIPPGRYKMDAVTSTSYAELL